MRGNEEVLLCKLIEGKVRGRGRLISRDQSCGLAAQTTSPNKEARLIKSYLSR